MSLDGLTTNYLSCGETPVQIPDSFDINTVPAYTSAVLRLESKIGGPGNVSPRTDGLLVNENPLNTLSINGVQHSLTESVLMIRGAHRLPSRSDVCEAEYALYFQNIFDFSRIVCLCIPIDIGSGATNGYFTSLGTNVNSGRPTLGSILPKTATYLNYRGADLRGRNAENSVPTQFCDPVSSVLTYFVSLTPIRMTAEDYNRLKNRAGAARKGPPKPIAPIAATRLATLASRVTGIQVNAGSGSGGSGGGRTDRSIAKSALKCFKLDADRDIVDNKIYVGGVGKPLEEAAKESELGVDIVEPSIKPGDIENWLGIILGIVVGIVACSFLVVKIWNGSFRGYFEAQKLYSSVVTPASLTSALPQLPSICPPSR